MFCTTTFSISLPESIYLCKQKGGLAISQGCYCAYSKNFINPRSQWCLKQAINIINLRASGWPTKVSCNPKFSKKITPNMIAEEKLCKNPAKYVCASINAENLDNHASLYERENKKAEQEQEVQEIIKISNPYARTCEELKEKDFKKCNQKKNLLLLNTLDNGQRLKKTKEIFEEARASYLKFLTKKIKNSTSSQNKILTKMIQTIKDTKFHPLVKGVIKRGASASPAENFITAGRMIFVVNTAPESLKKVFFHELAHIISITVVSKVEDGYINPFILNSVVDSYPFHKQIKCLQRTDSASSHSPTIECLSSIFSAFRKEVETKKGSDPKKYKKGMSILKTVENLHPDSSSNRSFDKDKKCGVSQLDELFADWISTEISAAEINLSEVNSKEGLEINSKEEKFINLNKRLSLSGINETLSLECTLYKEEQEEGSTELRDKNFPHSSSENRLNSIFFTHPKVTKALGCGQKYIEQINNLASPITKTKKYCSNNL